MLLTLPSFESSPSITPTLPPPLLLPYTHPTQSPSPLPYLNSTPSTSPHLLYTHPPDPPPPSLHTPYPLPFPLPFTHPTPSSSPSPLPASYQFPSDRALRLQIYKYTFFFLIDFSFFICIARSARVGEPPRRKKAEGKAYPRVTSGGFF